MTLINMNLMDGQIAYTQILTVGLLILKAQDGQISTKTEKMKVANARVLVGLRQLDQEGGMQGLQDIGHQFTQHLQPPR